MNRYGKPDVWSVKARSEGYPARSVYKLQELLRKFPLLLPPRSAGGGALLDLGAAPGSWSLYLLRTLGGVYRRPCARLVACDISPLSREYDGGLFDAANFCFIQGDMTAPETVAAAAARGPYELVLCDAAPGTSGSRVVDSLRSLELAETALGYAERSLARGGGFVAKFFQGAESADFPRKVRPLFKVVKVFKPAACRPNSMETYIAGIGRR